MSYKLSVDVGGTFTDIVLFNEETSEITTTKTPSTPSDYSRGIITGIRKICAKCGIEPAEISSFIHGTTVATNALLERKGTRTALITTNGFRDILEIARQRRPSLYNSRISRPSPVIPRSQVYELDERMLVSGEVLTPFNEAEARILALKIRDEGYASVAIGFVNAFINPTHENRMREIIEQVVPGATVCVSHEILPEIGEYERICTTCVNAYLMQIMQRYISNIENERTKLRVPVPVKIMQSNGGIMSAEAAGKRTVHTVFSGPVGGVLAAIHMAELLGEEHIVTIDIGGTSSDLALIDKYTVGYSQEGNLGGFPVRVPTVEMHTIGAGGGSIVWCDSANGIHVGPQSAGSSPGPACYGVGIEPTVTDANLLMGYLNPEHFLGGEMELDKTAAERAYKTIADKIGVSVDEAVVGIRGLADSNMCGGINVVSTQKGYDLREFSLMAFGGGGSLHAAALIDALNMRRAIIPLQPGNFSAIGCLRAAVRYDYMRSVIKPAQDISANEYNSLYKEMIHDAVVDMKAEGYRAGVLVFSAAAEMRYSGQQWTLSVPVDCSTTESPEKYALAFASLHERTYGYTLCQDAYFVSLKLTVTAPGAKPEFKQFHIEPGNTTDAVVGHRPLMFDGAFCTGTIYNRDHLYTGAVVHGPAMIEEYASSTPIPTGFRATVDSFRNLIIEKEGC